jgi:hypothetical protein
MANQNETQQLFSLLWLEYKGPKGVLAEAEEPFIQEVTRSFSDSVLASITHTPKPDISKYH